MSFFGELKKLFSYDDAAESAAKNEKGSIKEINVSPGASIPKRPSPDILSDAESAPEMENSESDIEMEGEDYESPENGPFTEAAPEDDAVEEGSAPEEEIEMPPEEDPYTNEEPGADPDTLTDDELETQEDVVTVTEQGIADDLSEGIDENDGEGGTAPDTAEQEDSSENSSENAAEEKNDNEHAHDESPGKKNSKQESSTIPYADLPGLSDEVPFDLNERPFTPWK